MGVARDRSLPWTVMPLPPPLEQMRRIVGDDVRGLLAAQPLPPEWFRRTEHDPGLFGPDAVVWRVHADRCGLIGGLRALMLQTLHPLAMAGVAQHSDYRHDPWGRLQRTASFIAVTTYGCTSAAERLIGRVRAIHDRVEGVAADGRPYRANDPHLLAWVHATEVDSFLRAYQRYGASTLTDAEADRYVAEMGEIATRLADLVLTDMATDLAPLRPKKLARRLGVAPRVAIRSRMRLESGIVRTEKIPGRSMPSSGGRIGAAPGERTSAS